MAKRKFGSGHRQNKQDLRSYNHASKDSTVFLALHTQHSAHSKSVLDDSLIAEYHITYCTIALSRCEISDDVLVLIWKFALDMPMNDTKKKLASRLLINTAINKQLSPLHCKS